MQICSWRVSAYVQNAQSGRSSSDVSKENILFSKLEADQGTRIVAPLQQGFV